MTTAAIEFIWKAIMESERSNRLQFMSDEMLLAAVVHGSPQPRPDQSGEVGYEPIADGAISPKRVDSGSLQADRRVGSWRPHHTASIE